MGIYSLILTTWQLFLTIWDSRWLLNMPEMRLENSTEIQINIKKIIQQILLETSMQPSCHFSNKQLYSSRFCSVFESAIRLLWCRSSLSTVKWTTKHLMQPKKVILKGPYSEFIQYFDAAEISYFERAIFRVYSIFRCSWEKLFWKGHIQSLFNISMQQRKVILKGPYSEFIQYFDARVK